MGILEQIITMRGQGNSDAEIINYLQERGVPPKDIQNALSQAQIKSAVSGGFGPEEGMQQSIMGQEQYSPDYSQEYPQQYQNPVGQYTQEPTQQYYPQEQYPAQEPYYPQEAYAQDYAAQESYPGTNDTGAFIDVAEQVFSDKVKKFQSSLDSLNEFKNLAETRLRIMEEKLKRIEAVLDQLQISILEKIGSYGDNLRSIKKEMSMMQDSFGKMMGRI